MLDKTERKKFRLGGGAELHELGLIGRAVCREGTIQEDGESETKELEETEDFSQTSDRCRKGDVGDAGMGTRRDGGGRARGFGLGEKAPRGSRRVEA